MHHGKKQKLSRKKIMKPLLLVLALAVCAVVVLAVIRVWETRQSEEQTAAMLSASREPEEEEPEEAEARTLGESSEDTGSDGGAQIWYDGEWYTLKQDLETILLLGVDEFEEDSSAGEYRNTQQADFLMLLIFDTEDETFTALHLNRDTMTDIQVLGVTGDLVGTTTEQLALAHTYGSDLKDSCRNTVTAVSNLLYGTEIDHYVSLTMDAVAILNDLVGGVTVTVLDDFSDVDPSLVEGETITLKGDQALTYVRTRKNLEDSSNLNRMERQRQYLTSLLEQTQTAISGDSTFSLSALLEINEYLVSDCTITQLSDLANSMGVYTFEEVYTIDGEAVVGEEYMEYYVDEDALQDLIIELFYERVE